MNAKLVILGCGSSLGVPRIDGFWGNTNKSNKKNIRTRCSSVIVKGGPIFIVPVPVLIRSNPFCIHFSIILSTNSASNASVEGFLI